MNTQTVSQEQSSIAAVNLTGLPVPAPQLNLIPPPTQAEIDAAELKLATEAQAKKTQALAKFEAVVPFRLEAETIGAKAIKRTVSKSGAVSIGILGKKELAAISGLKGGDLDAWTRMREDEVKGEQAQIAARLSSDNNWTHKAIQLSAKGDVITLKWKKVLPQTVSLAAPTDEQIAQSLGITAADVKALRDMNAKAAQVAKAKETELKAAQELAAEALKHGLSPEEYAILKDDPEAGKSDNDGAVN